MRPGPTTPPHDDDEVGEPKRAFNCQPRRIRIVGRLSEQHQGFESPGARIPLNDRPCVMLSKVLPELIDQGTVGDCVNGNVVNQHLYSLASDWPRTEPRQAACRRPFPTPPEYQTRVPGKRSRPRATSRPRRVSARRLRTRAHGGHRFETAICSAATTNSWIV